MSQRRKTLLLFVLKVDTLLIRHKTISSDPDVIFADGGRVRCTSKLLRQVLPDHLSLDGRRNRRCRQPRLLALWLLVVADDFTNEHTTIYRSRSSR